MRKLLIFLIILISLININADCPPDFYCQAIPRGNGSWWVPVAIRYKYYSVNGIYEETGRGFSKVDPDNPFGTYVATPDQVFWPCNENWPKSYLSEIRYRDYNTWEYITNYYSTNAYNEGGNIPFVATNGYFWGGFYDYNLNFGYTNNSSIPLYYEFYDPVTGSNHVGALNPGQSVNFNLNYKLSTNVNDHPFFLVHAPEDSPFPFEDFQDLNWGSSGGGNSFDTISRNLTPTNKFSEAESQVVFTNSNFYKVTQMTNQAGQTIAKIENLTDLSDVLAELKKINNKLDSLAINSNSVSNSIDSTISRWSSLTNSMINTNIAGLQNVLNSINSFNPNGVIASNSISGDASSDFWKIRIPINGKDYWLKIPIDDQKILNFFNWLNSFFKLAITFIYYLFCVYLAYKLVTDTLQTPSHTVNGAAVMGTHSNFLVAKACLAVVLVVIATVLQQFLAGFIQAPVRDLFIAWQAQTSSVGFLAESFKLFLKVFPVDYFLGYLGSALAVFFNFWIFKSTLQIIKNAMA